MNETNPLTLKYNAKPYTYEVVGRRNNKRIIVSLNYNFNNLTETQRQLFEFEFGCHGISDFRSRNIKYQGLKYFFTLWAETDTPEEEAVWVCEDIVQSLKDIVGCN